MIRWLADLFSHTSDFPRCKREVFRYWTGKRYINGDPLLIGAELATSEEFNIDMDVKKSAIPGDVGTHAYIRLINGTRKAFKIPSVEDGGLDPWACERLLLAFQKWCDQKKSSMPPSPIPVQPFPDISDAPPTTPSSSDSGSTAGEVSDGLPAESRSELRPLSETPPMVSGKP